MSPSAARPLKFVFVLVAACGNNSSSTAVSARPDATTAASERAAATRGPARESKAHQIVSAFAESADPSAKACIAAKGLGEVDFGLPRGQVKALSAVCSGATDPSQCSALLGMGIDATGHRPVEKRCDLGMEELKSTVAKLPAERAGVVAKSCKIDLPAGVEPQSLDGWALLTSAIVGDELSADGVITEDEKKISEALARLCRMK